MAFFNCHRVCGGDSRIWIVRASRKGETKQGFLCRDCTPGCSLRCTRRKKSILDVYPAIFADKESQNRRAFLIFKKYFPLPFYVGCAANWFELLMEDSATFDMFKELMDIVRSVATFIKWHKNNLTAFKHIAGPNRLMLKLSPAIRFSNADFMMTWCICNNSTLEKMINENGWRSVTKRISHKWPTVFEQIVSHMSSQSMFLMHYISVHLTKITHHQKQKGTIFVDCNVGKCIALWHKFMGR